MSRFEDVPQDVYDLFMQVRTEHFSELRNAGFKILFDTKKRMSSGKIILARIQKANELVRKLTDHEVEDGYDYIIYLDKNVWNSCAEVDKVRIMRHELRHCFVDFESRTNPYKIHGHTIEDFYEEIELNQDNPRWRERLGELALAFYEG